MRTTATIQKRIRSFSCIVTSACTYFLLYHKIAKDAPFSDAFLLTTDFILFERSSPTLLPSISVPHFFEKPVHGEGHENEQCNDASEDVHLLLYVFPRPAKL